MNSILEQALRLPESSRRQLVDDLNESLQDKSNDDLTSEQLKLIDQRIEDLNVDPNKAVTWNKVRDKWRKLS